MKYKGTKALICAVAMSMLFTGSGFESNAANLPAAGLGLTLSDGSSVKDIRDDVKNKKESSETQSSTETEATQERETETESAKQTETESVAETESVKETETESAKETETQGRQPVETETIRGTTSAETQSAAAETETVKSTRETETETQATEETLEKEIVEAVEPVIKEPETKASTEEADKKEEKETLIIAQVNDYVNIRSTPSTDSEIVGKLYNNSVGVLINEEDGWYQMKSGNVEGYVKAEYFKAGDEAKQIADEVGDRIATVNTQTLKVRYEASLDAPVLGLVPGGEELTVLDEENGFVKVSIEEGDGWVSMDYVILETEYVTAESVAEEKARLDAEKKAKEEAQKAAAAAEAKLLAEKQKKEEEQKAKEAQATAQSDQSVEQLTVSGEQQSTQTVSVSGGAGLGSAVADFAVQFVGNPYVYGGTSLTNGADCSGFVMSVYKNFGVSLPHSSSADRRVGYGVGSLSEAQPGDLICYSGHVGIYIGGGQIVHASTAATGIKISDANYRKPVAIRRIF